MLPLLLQLLHPVVSVGSEWRVACTGRILADAYLTSRLLLLQTLSTATAPSSAPRSRQRSAVAPHVYISRPPTLPFTPVSPGVVVACHGSVESLDIVEVSSPAAAACRSIMAADRSIACSNQCRLTVHYARSQHGVATHR